jgi:hypothetical protein
MKRTSYAPASPTRAPEDQKPGHEGDTPGPHSRTRASTWALCRPFKCHFHLLRSLFEDNLAGRQIILSLHTNEDVVETNLAVPGDREAERFAHLIDPFAHPDGRWFYPSLVASFIECGLLDSQAVHRLDEHCHNVEVLPMPLVVNQVPMSGPAVFRLVADGGLLRTSAHEMEGMRLLRQFPPSEAAIQYSFHVYANKVFHLLRHLYEAIRSLEVAGVEVAPAEVSLIQPRCIYCLEGDAATFSSVEHVYPEALGNRDLILPRGTVCDGCNNGLLSQLDECLVETPPLDLLRVIMVPYNFKTGKYLTARSPHAKLARVGPRSVEFTDEGLPRKLRRKLSAGEISWRGRKRFDPISFFRSLYKIGLGVVACQVGHEAALHSRYDAARAFIVGKSGFRNYGFLSLTVTPNDHVSGVLDTRSGSVLTSSIYGMVSLLNLEESPPFAAKPPEGFGMFALWK